MDDSPIEGLDEDLDTFGPSSTGADAANAEGYVDRMRRLLVADGVRFPDNKVAKISRLDPLEDSYLHAVAALSEGRPPGPALRSVRWMLEEYRISLFAQEVRTAGTVSDQRIRKALASAT